MILKNQAIGADLVHLWGFHVVVAIASYGVRALVVGHHQYYVGGSVRKPGIESRR